MDTWTIYDHPSDFPNTYVARKFHLDNPTADFIVSPTLKDLRDIMIQRGLTPIARAPEDDPVIVETWI